MQSLIACRVLLCDKGKYERQRGRRRKARGWRTKGAMIDGVVHLQVLPQPLVLLKEELQSKFQIKVNLSGERDDVHRPQVPAVDTSIHRIKKPQHTGKTR